MLLYLCIIAVIIENSSSIPIKVEEVTKSNQDTTFDPVKIDFPNERIIEHRSEVQGIMFLTYHLFKTDLQREGLHISLVAKIGSRVKHGRVTTNEKKDDLKKSKLPKELISALLEI